MYFPRITAAHARCQSKVAPRLGLGELHRVGIGGCRSGWGRRLSSLVRREGNDQAKASLRHDFVELNDRFNIGVLGNVGENFGAMFRKDGLECRDGIDEDRRDTDKRRRRSGRRGDPAPNLDAVPRQPCHEWDVLLHVIVEIKLRVALVGIDNRYSLHKGNPPRTDRISIPMPRRPRLYPTLGRTISNRWVVRVYWIPPMRPIISSEFRSSLPSLRCALLM